MPKKPSAPFPTTLIQRELADLVGVSVRTLIRWTQAGLPRLKNGRYNVKRAMAWIREHEREQGKSDRQPTDYEDAKARKMNAEAELAEYDLAQRRAQLMTIEQFDAVVEESHQRVRAVVLSIPSRNARDFVGLKSTKAARAKLQRLTQDIVAEIRSAGGLDDDEVAA